MGSILTRENSKGEKSYRAEIVIRRRGRIIYRESKTFKRKNLAKHWVQVREVELAIPGALEKAKLQ